jgi:hypothetical protein
VLLLRATTNKWKFYFLRKKKRQQRETNSRMEKHFPAVFRFRIFGVKENQWKSRFTFPTAESTSFPLSKSDFLFSKKYKVKWNNAKGEAGAAVWLFRLCICLAMNEHQDTFEWTVEWGEVAKNQKNWNEIKIFGFQTFARHKSRPLSLTHSLTLVAHEICELCSSLVPVPLHQRVLDEWEMGKFQLV